MILCSLFLVIMITSYLFVWGVGVVCVVPLAHALAEGGSALYYIISYHII